MINVFTSTRSQYLNAQSGYYGTPLLTNLSKEYLDIAISLLERGVDVDSGQPGPDCI
jgi:hypothetical protein